MSIAQRALVEFIKDARERTLRLAAGLSDEQLLGPRLAIVNPLRWELGHVAWFQELWALRTAHGEPPIRSDGDALYDSSAIPHDVRWDLPLPSRAETIRYLELVRDRVLEKLAAREASTEERYYLWLALFHEDMHDEAFSYSRQTLQYPPPPTYGATPQTAGALAGDVELPGGIFKLGPAHEEFIFDNEKYAHEVEVRPFAIARAPVTQAEYLAFIEESGHSAPIYWRKDSKGWQRREFDRWVPLEPHRPVLHVSWHEAQAYCRWAKRRLPAEAEWELAATMQRDGTKARFPWGNDPPTPHHAHLDTRSLGCADVAAFPLGESAYGVRQLIGNVWEWTADDFQPYPGFSPDPYRDYSQPWFGDHKVLRGGCFVTRSRMIRSAYRNFYKPDRNDVWAGFRTCAL